MKLRRLFLPNYEKMYFRLMKAVSDTVDILQKAQYDAEEILLKSSNEEYEKRKTQKKY